MKSGKVRQFLIRFVIKCSYGLYI